MLLCLSFHSLKKDLYLSDDQIQLFPFLLEILVYLVEMSPPQFSRCETVPVRPVLLHSCSQFFLLLGASHRHQSGQDNDSRYYRPLPVLTQARHAIVG